MEFILSFRSFSAALCVFKWPRPLLTLMLSCSMGTIEDHEAYVAAKNDPDFMNSPQVANPSSIQPPTVGELAGTCRQLFPVTAS